MMEKFINDEQDEKSTQKSCLADFMKVKHYELPSPTFVAKSNRSKCEKVNQH